MIDIGPTLPFSVELHKQKYRGDGESYRDVTNRLAGALKDTPEHWEALREIVGNMRFLFAGRIQAAVGSLKRVTPFNCFVSGTILDNFTGTGGIMMRALQAAETMRMGGGIGYDFSTLRPEDSIIKSTQAKSSGPLGFMPIYNEVCIATSSVGNRRGAQMGIMRVDHPDIEKFIHVKGRDSEGKEAVLKGFNLSVAITDKFMQAVMDDGEFDLVFDRKVYKTVKARVLWEMIMRSTWDYAEPGVVFIDRINEMNNLHYCETIASTNPCGEQPLPPYGACLLGSINLVKYVVIGDLDNSIDYHLLTQDIPHIVRALDNVIDGALYPLPEQELEAKNKRRLGIGVTGLANAIEALAHPYGSPGFLEVMEKILTMVRDECYRASIELAREKGPFPLYDKTEYICGDFIQALPEDILNGIYDYGIRNSHLTSIAPTGTISLTADNVSSGVEPVFNYSFERDILMDGGKVTETVGDYGYRVWGVKGKVCSEVTATEHVAVLTLAQKYVDSAVSKTCNVPVTMDWEEFKNIYMAAWKLGAKGCTTFTEGGKRQGILQNVGEEGEACYIDEKGRKECG